MANPSVTYTFSNGTTADASQVNTNFTDLINSLTDGTKSLSIDALTVAGAATLNGAVTLGNGSPDDITVTGSLASSIAIKTNNSYDIGAATLALAGIYLGAPSSRSTRLRAHQSLSASNTLVLPNGGGTAEYGMSTDGSGNLDFRIPAIGFIRNYSLTASVAANALTVALKDASGSDPSSTSPVAVMFRSSTATTGTPVIRQATAATSVVVSSGSTLGHASGQVQYVYVYLIDNSGTPELAVSGQKITDEGALVTTTVEGGAGAADSGIVLYSTTARANVPVRLIGRLKSNQATAGTWASAISEISLVPFESVTPRSCIIVTTGAGHGSTNTMVRRIETAHTSVGSGITATNSAANGTSFTINEDGVYSIHYTDNASGTASFGISLNSTQLTTDISSITAANRLAFCAAGSSGIHTCSVTLYLRTGDVIRPHTNSVPAVTNAYQTIFAIAKVA